MIVCSCNVLTEDAVRDATRGPDGAGRVADVFERLDCRAGCGRCAPTIRRLIRDSVAEDLATRKTVICNGDSCPVAAEPPRPSVRPHDETVALAAE